MRRLLPDWETDSEHFLAQFRSEAGPHLGEPGVAALIERLRDTDPTFRASLDNHGIEGFTSRERRFRHPHVGVLHLEHHQLTPADHPDLHVVIYTPLDDGHTPERLHALLEPNT